MDLDGTSQLYTFFDLGCYRLDGGSRRNQAIESAPDRPSRQSAEMWLNELIWRRVLHFDSVPLSRCAQAGFSI
jgi:hypothetical protein